MTRRTVSCGAGIRMWVPKSGWGRTPRQRLSLRLWLLPVAASAPSCTCFAVGRGPARCEAPHEWAVYHAGPVAVVPCRRRRCCMAPRCPRSCCRGGAGSGNPVGLGTDAGNVACGCRRAGALAALYASSWRRCTGPCLGGRGWRAGARGAAGRRGGGYRWRGGSKWRGGPSYRAAEGAGAGTRVARARPRLVWRSAALAAPLAKRPGLGRGGPQWRAGPGQREGRRRRRRARRSHRGGGAPNLPGRVGQAAHRVPPRGAAACPGTLAPAACGGAFEARGGGSGSSLRGRGRPCQLRGRSSAELLRARPRPPPEGGRIPHAVGTEKGNTAAHKIPFLNTEA